ncbi:MAG: hypothetical protein LKF75_02075 [Bacilli bacterium]|jgi:hypothetical protein|nr:hypothetical protein [Bacilli bacterium]MCH4211056.1 hypothetical protein [Bacilli bacterium]MCH4228477.1 hypothetical protein [Bacilli bacterium]MCH4277587.1 hypothetical protein [Bacilli bacterium]MCI2054926.1 hypothetical protein [Bacilli bacterium]
MMPLNLIPTAFLIDYASFGDSLWLLATSYIDKLVKENHEIFRHDMPRYEIKSCNGCGSCYSKEVACSYLDDFNKIPPEILFSDEVYLFGEGPLSSAFHNALSKFEVFPHSSKKTHVQKFVFVYIGKLSNDDEKLVNKAAEMLSCKLSLLQFKDVDEAKAFLDIQ